MGESELIVVTRCVRRLSPCRWMASQARRMMTAPASLLLYTRFMEHLAIWKSTGVFIAVIRMVLVDTASWAVLFILLQVGPSLTPELHERNPSSGLCTSRMPKIG